MRIIIWVLVYAIISVPCYAARNFNGTTDKVSMPGNGNAIDITTGSMSISFWFNVANSSGEYRPVNKSDATDEQWEFIYNFASNTKMAVNTHQAGVPAHPSSICGITVSPGSWHQVGMTWDPTPSDNFAVYLDGVGCTALAISGNLISTGANMYLGTYNNGASNSYPGKIAELGIWNVTLTFNEMLALGHNVSPTWVRKTALVGYWPETGAGGASVDPDFSGNKINGTITGTTAGFPCPCGRPVYIP